MADVYGVVMKKLAVLFFSFILSSYAQAVTVATPDGSHTSDPGTGVPWDSVIQVSSASGVYLGGGWVLTAEHVYDNAYPSTVVFGGVTYTEDLSYSFNLSNPPIITGSATADLVLFRLTEEVPLLPTINVGTIPDATEITMIGFGGGKTWGINQTENPKNIYNVNSGGLNTGSFRTDYDTATLGEGQAVVGDSGGGAFYYDGSEWKLGGIMIGIDTDSDPDLTYYADMEVYASEINSTIALYGSVPEPSTMLLLGIGGGAFLRRRR